jgi:hypoxanthine-DNA glycosylase
MRCVGFEAVARGDARVFILDTLPSTESLACCEYYAKKANKFWWVMGKLVGASPDKAYEDRLDLIKKSGIALWDVCASADRSGSADRRILLPTVVPNDFSSFLGAHKHVKLICFNGRLADKLYRRDVLTSVSLCIPIIRREVLPSTSPAYAAMPPEAKLSHWRRTLSEFIDLKRC